MLSRPASMTPQAIGDFYVQLLKVIGSPGFPVPEAEVRERANLAFKRNYHPQGVARQMMAIMADSKRARLNCCKKYAELLSSGRGQILQSKEDHCTIYWRRQRWDWRHEVTAAR